MFCLMCMFPMESHYTQMEHSTQEHRRKFPVGMIIVMFSDASVMSDFEKTIWIQMAH